MLCIGKKKSSYGITREHIKVTFSLTDITNEHMKPDIQCQYTNLTLAIYPLTPGDPMLRGNRSVPEDRAVRQEGWLHARLHFPAAFDHAHQPRPGRAVCADARAGR